MLFAYFKMNKFERNPKKYMKKQCHFLLEKGFHFKVSNCNAEYCFEFYLNETHIYFYYENEYVDCCFENANTTKTNLTNIVGNLPAFFDKSTNMEKMNYLINLVHKNLNLIDIRKLTKLEQALKLSKEKKHMEAYPIYEELYNKNKNATNAFNLFQCAVYCGKKDVEEKLYSKLKNYVPKRTKDPIELSGCFVRFYYGIILCETKRNDEAIEIIDYLIDVISHYKITDPTFLYIRGVPTASMIKDLIEKVFVNDNTKLNEYLKKLKANVDKDTLKYELKNY